MLAVKNRTKRSVATVQAQQSSWPGAIVGVGKSLDSRRGQQPTASRDAIHGWHLGSGVVGIGENEHTSS